MDNVDLLRRLLVCVFTTLLRKLEESDGIMAISLSKDGQYLLVNTTPKVSWLATQVSLSRCIRSATCQVTIA